MTITLPEITVVGRPDSVPTTVDDWFAEGFTAGWRNPAAQPDAPAPLNDEALSAYFQGVQAGANAKRNIEVDLPYRGPSIGPEIQGQLASDVEREWQAAWQEFLRHEDPHTDQERYPQGEPEPPTIELVL